jgi:hypothetical protein
MFVDLLIEGGAGRAFLHEPASPAVAGFEPRSCRLLDVEVRNLSGGTYVVIVSPGTVLPAGAASDDVDPTESCPGRVPGGAGRGADDEPGDDDIVWIERGAKRLELDEQVRDLLFLETERFPLCRPDCKGVCPRCGQDLNVGSCDCMFEAHDSRWKALERLRSAEPE